MITLLLNICGVCFFIAEIIKLQRKWKARWKMDSTSLEGTIFHLIGNSVMIYISYYFGAWVTMSSELFLTSMAIITIYWKSRWLWRKLHEKAHT